MDMHRVQSAVSGIGNNLILNHSNHPPPRSEAPAGQSVAEPGVGESHRAGAVETIAQALLEAGIT